MIDTAQPPDVFRVSGLELVAHSRVPLGLSPLDEVRWWRAKSHARALLRDSAPTVAGT